MSSFFVAAVAYILVFFCTNIDEFVVLVILMAETKAPADNGAASAADPSGETPPPRMLHVVLGTLLAFTVIVGISLLGLVLGLFVPVEWLGVGGFLPILFGLEMVCEQAHERWCAKEECAKDECVKQECAKEEQQHTKEEQDADQHHETARTQHPAPTDACQETTVTCHTDVKLSFSSQQDETRMSKDALTRMSVTRALSVPLPALTNLDHHVCLFVFLFFVLG